MPQEPIHTKRLVLQSFAPGDAPRLSALAGSRAIADAMISIPHPYTLATAEEAIARYEREFAAGTDVHFAVGESSNARDFVGYVAIRHIDRNHLEGELSFWIHPQHAGRGLATEAARAVLGYGFDVLGLSRICAYHMVKNGASKRVLERLGMSQEGHLRERVRKGNVFEDVLLWATVRSTRLDVGS